MSCLGDPSRFQLVRRLLGGERCVSDLARQVGLSQSCTTRHLQALQREQIVRGERSGKRVLFRLCLDEPQVGALLEWAMSPRAGKPGVPDSERARLTRDADLHFDGSSPDPGASVSRPPAGARPHGTTRPYAADRAATRSPAEPIAPGAGPERLTGPEREPAPAPLRPPRHDLEDFLL